ncbi:sigma-70 family RNA polymerase sigma factor [Salinibacillus xinjiangensis]|uniref:sigma-70 family RNA polymerase sigma factor n=1 Tax=Salinibacillus xinjiangensis TaxID=1229268 RepID=UPI00129ADFE4|nr:sigma-70 family RNA polymerase sigma factor [Salinibacillus xinjiangensis]
MVETSDFQEVINDHERIIYHLIQKYGIRDPQGEFYQEGLFALWRAYETYEEKQGKFSSYAYFLIQKALLSLIRARNHQKEKDEVYRAHQTIDMSQVSATLEMGFDPYLYDQIKEVLTDNEMKWFTLFIFEDLTIKKIANKEQVTKDAVKNWGRRAKGKIKKLLIND